MDLNQLEVFFVLAKTKNFTDTARLMHVTQSAISHAIKKLEINTDCSLIDRSKRRFFLTPAGEDLYRSCELIFSEVERAGERIKKHKKQPIWKITLGSTVEFGNTVLIPLINDFIQHHPQYHLDFRFSNHNLKEKLSVGLVDFIIDCKDHFETNLNRIPLFKEEFVVVASADFVSCNNITDPKELKKTTVLSMDADCMWWKNFWAILPLNMRPDFKKIICINHVRGLISGAIAGMGVSFVPRYTIRKELSSGVLKELFPQISPQADDFCIYIKRDKLTLEKNRELIDFLKKIPPSEFGNPKG